VEAIWIEEEYNQLNFSLSFFFFHLHFCGTVLSKSGAAQLEFVREIASFVLFCKVVVMFFFVFLVICFTPWLPF